MAFEVPLLWRLKKDKNPRCPGCKKVALDQLTCLSCRRLVCYYCIQTNLNQNALCISCENKKKLPAL
jgi:hypothetical protein